MVINNFKICLPFLLADKAEADRVNKSLDEITQRWKNLKVEISSVQTMLEEVIEYWRRYEACVDLFHVWLGDAEQVLKKPPEERGVRYSGGLLWELLLVDVDRCISQYLCIHMNA